VADSHFEVVVSHTGLSAVGQSASTRHPPAGSQTPDVLQAPDRHTAASLVLVHVPSPLA
jgi:hypothetical protein